LIIGNGGGPLSGAGQFFGFAMIEQAEDGNIRVEAYDRFCSLRDAWAVMPGGEPAE
jgi:hypothetical protein